jgi:hypothetical protein
MGIYIKGMTKPKSCNECPIALWSLPKGCNLEIGICPIVEVAEPHGKLIDADVCKQRVYDGSRTPYKTCPTVIEAEGE